MGAFSLKNKGRLHHYFEMCLMCMCVGGGCHGIPVAVREHLCGILLFPFTSMWALGLDAGHQACIMGQQPL